MHAIDFSGEAVTYMNHAYTRGTRPGISVHTRGTRPGPWNRSRPRELAQTGGNDPGPWNGIHVHPSLAAHQDMQ